MDANPYLICCRKRSRRAGVLRGAMENLEIQPLVLEGAAVNMDVRNLLGLGQEVFE
jgi:hypothetical protein